MKIRMLVLTALFAALTAAGSFLKIPAPVAPITLQFFFTLAAGMLLGPRYGALSQLLYMIMGLIGLPVFSTGGGLGYILRPSFGFVIGFIASAALTGYMSRREKRFSRLLLACLAGTGVMYVIAMPYLFIIQNMYLGKGLSMWYLLQTGMLIYLPGDILKGALCSFVGTRLRKISSLRV